MACPYNGFMTTIHDHSAASVVPQFARAGSFLEGLAAQDFAELGGALAPGARLRALLPLGLREWTGAEVIAGRFAGWFGDTEDFDLVEATVGEVGGRLHLHWRLRLRAERLGRLVHRRTAGLRRYRRGRPHRPARPALHRLPA